MSTQTHTPSDYIVTERQLKKNNNLKDINIAFLSSYTSEVLRPYLRVELSKFGYFSKIYFTPYNQNEQEVLDIDSNLYISNPNVVVIHNRLEDMYHDLIYRFMSYSQGQLNDIFYSITQRFYVLISNLRKNTNAKIIIVNFSITDESEYSFFSSSKLDKMCDFVNKINKELSKMCEEFMPCFSLNYAKFIQNIGLKNFKDSRLNFLAHVPLSNYAQIEISKSISRVINAVFNPPKKCLVLDLDNTLWGGVIGEDGISGIQLGEGYPGNVFRDFQIFLLGLRDQGVLLAISSKNNISDALSVFDNHSECVLSKEDFSEIEIGWNEKWKSLQSISKNLNIGLDSLVFFDDSPFERELVKDKLPEVNVIDVPLGPIDFKDSIIKSCFFDDLIFTKEDSSRAELYKQEKKRKMFERLSTVEDFFKNLEMEVVIGELNESIINRFVQLLNKTNQFNLTTRRHSASDIYNIIDNGGMAFWISVKDRFGDSGISGACIVKKINNNEWIIDTFLLSCRIIGRKIETVFLHYVLERIRDTKGCIVYGDYIKTKKNLLVSGFYKDNGFSLLNDTEKKYWVFDLSKSKIKPPNFIKIKYSKK